MLGQFIIAILTGVFAFLTVVLFVFIGFTQLVESVTGYIRGNISE